MEYVSTLQELITALEYGNRFHISIEFEYVHRELIKTLSVSRSHVIHATPFCDEVKERKGLNPCLVCKGKAMDKAKKTGLPFGGLCVNGVYEFCYPVFSGGGLLCIIFLGNIISTLDEPLDPSAKLYLRVQVGEAAPVFYDPLWTSTANESGEVVGDSGLLAYIPTSSVDIAAADVRVYVQ